jgi:hypothetical protein
MEVAWRDESTVPGTHPYCAKQDVYLLPITRLLVHGWHGYKVVVARHK